MADNVEADLADLLAARARVGDEGESMTVAEVADYLNIGEIAVRSFIAEGRLAARHDGPRQPWVILRRDVEDFLDGCRV